MEVFGPNVGRTVRLESWPFKDLDHTADVQLHAWGDTLEEAFEQCAMAMFGYMTDTGTVEPLQTVEVETQGDDLQSLLFHFLDEWLYKFSADEFFIPREVKVLNIDQRNFKLRSIGWGEEFSLSKHPQLSAMVWESSRRWPKSLGPCTHVGDLEEAPGSWLRIDTALAVAVNWGVNQWMEYLSLSASPLSV
ncbi:protein archease isoform X2 [Oryctolagus cuniculus]|uniref:protein archease isoform X2 n=1 Tax=Oryctolagus cuniculus TaxID=9986 RepID=UPI00222EB0F7|nr:protein archease isoform X2 [Oryctolagus cuniculus]